MGLAGVTLQKNDFYADCAFSWRCIAQAAQLIFVPESQVQTFCIFCFPLKYIIPWVPNGPAPLMICVDCQGRDRVDPEQLSINPGCQSSWIHGKRFVRKFAGF